jgi:two-component system sensor histidine kinase UhpB
MVTVAWLSLGIASVALALIAALVLRSERESTAILHHLSVISLNLQDVLSDLAGAEAEAREYGLTGRGSSLENFEQSNKALALEFDRLTALVKNNPAERQEVERVRFLVQQDLDELRKSIAIRTAAGHQVASEILTDRARKLTEALRQSITGIGNEQESTLARLARRRRVRLASALAAVSGALLLAAAYVWIGQIIMARSASRRRKTEEALRASEKRFQALCEQAPVGIYSTDAHGLCVYANPRWSQISGLSAAENLGHGWAKALHPDDRETVFESWKTNSQQGAPWEFRVLTPQGELRWIRALGGPIYSDRGELTGYIGTTEDITERVLAYRMLQESDALNRAILNSLPANIAVLNRDGKIRAINEEWQRFVEANGDPPACFLNTGVNYLEACKRAADGGSSDAENALTGIQDVLTGQRQLLQMEYPCHSATETRWFRMTVTPLAGVAAGGVVISHVDITELKRAEDSVQEALEQLQLITDNMSAGVTRCRRDLRYVWVNPEYAAWLGLAPKKIMGRPIRDVIGEEGFEVIRPHIDKVLSGEREEYETQVTLREVGRRWIHAVYAPTKGQDQKVDGWIAVVADVTERHEAEGRLRESEERFRATFFQAAVGISETTIDGHWLLLNDRLCQILGYSRDELLGKSFYDFTHPDDREPSLAAVRQLLAGELSSSVIEKRYIRKDGVPVWVRVFMSLVLHNETPYLVRVVEDITEKIQAERAIQDSRQELRALTKRLINAQEDEGRRISRQLHDDFSQRLASLAFDTSSLVQALPPSRDQIKEKLRDVHTRILQMSADVRGIAHQLHPSILEDLGLAATLRQMCEEFSAREKIEATLEQETIPGSLPKDVASCLYWIAREALHNISKYAHASRVRLLLSGSHEGIQACIQDDGVGFDAEAGRRHGLGIVSMNERVRMVQGELSIHSQPGRGTEVRAFIPLSKE